MKPKSISFSALSKLSGLTVRRLQQLAAEKILPGPVDRGELPHDEAIAALFAYVRGARGEMAGEKLKLLRAKRIQAESEIARHVEIPAAKIEEAARLASGQLNGLASNIYNLGIVMTEDQRRRVHDLAVRAASDFQLWIRQWSERQVEILQNQESSTVQTDEPQS